VVDTHGARATGIIKRGGGTRGMTDALVNKELRGLESDRLMTKLAVENERNRYADLLRGNMGKDIDDVLSGKIVVKLTRREKLKYKLKSFFDRLFKMF
jgi:hypothetical protein